jgi:hypothetical protein
MWPDQVFFTSSPSSFQDYTQCVRLYNPLLWQQGWANTSAQSTDVLCAADGTGGLGMLFYFNQSPPANPEMVCLPFNPATETPPLSGVNYWPNSWLCVPLGVQNAYAFEFRSTSGGGGVSVAGKVCLLLFKPSDNNWAFSNNYLCGLANSPFFNDGQQVYPYAAPTITSLSTTHGPTAANIPLTITGTNLGPAPSASTITVWIGPYACPYSSSTPNTQVVCLVPFGEGTNRIVYVDVAGQQSPQFGANVPIFNYDPPIVMGMSTSVPLYTEGGALITVTGQNFGQTPGNVYIGGSSVKCSLVTYGDQALTCQIPPGVGKNLAITIRTNLVVGNQLSTGVVLMSYADPVILSLSPLLLSTACCTPITVTGHSFGYLTYGTLIIRVAPATINGVSANGPLTFYLSAGVWSHTRITANGPPGAGGHWNFAVQVATNVVQESPSTPIAFYPPVITDIWPTQMFSSSGSTYLLTVRGSNFGYYQGTLANFLSVLRVNISGYNCYYSSTAQWSYSAITCQIPNINLGPNNPLQVCAWDQCSNTVNFGNSPQWINPTDPRNVGRYPTEGGTVFNLTGVTNLGTLQNTIVYDNSTGIIMNITAIGSTWVTVQLPPGWGIDHCLTIKTNNIAPARYHYQCWWVSYDLPQIASISPVEGLADGTNLLTIKGANFGHPPFSISGLSIKIGGNPCVPQLAGWDDHQIICKVPAGTGYNQSVTVAAASQQSLEGIYYSYVNPNVSSISPANGPALGGTVVTLIGTGFNIFPPTIIPYLTVDVGSVTLQVYPVSSTKVVFTTPGAPSV